MFRLDGPQVRRLRVAVQAAYQGELPGRRFGQFVYELCNIQLSDLTVDTAEFPLQLSEALTKLNAQGLALKLLDGLEQEFPQAADLLQVIIALRAESNLIIPDADAIARLKSLEKAHLLLDGLPFINRSRLREMMTELMDSFSPARVGVVAGGTLSGKSWSLHLIRASCKAMQQPKVRSIVLDLELLQPGNDPVIVWADLMRQLLARPSPDPPPVDTKGGQYVDRLVTEVCRAWETCASPDSEEEKPWLLIVFDHLDKGAAAAVGPAVVDFAEALALAAVKPARRLEGGRVLLLGFPRGFSPPSQELTVEEMAPREELNRLTLDEVKRYLAEVGTVIGRGATPETEAAASQALRDAEAKTAPEERRAALTKMSATISRHVRAMVRA
jgi:hypothetical protein